MKTSINNYKTVLASIALGSLLSLQARATSEIRSEFALFLDSNFLYQQAGDLIPEISKQQEVQIGNLKYTDPVDIEINDIRLHSDYKIPKPVRNPNSNDWTFTTQNLNAQITVGEIKAFKIIEKHVGSIVFRVKIEGKCSNTRLELDPSKTRLQAVVRSHFENGRVRLELADFNASWDPDAWKVMSLDCTGPEGLDQILSRRAVQELRNIEPFFGALKTEIENQIATLNTTLTDEILAQLTNLGSSKDYTITLHPQDLKEIDSQSLMIEGAIRFHFPDLYPGENRVADFKLNHAASGNSLHKQTLHLPLETLKALIDHSQMLGKLSYHFMASEIDGFRNIMKRRLLQFLFFPDLLRQKKNTDFQCQLDVQGLPNWGATLETDPNESQGVISMELGLPLSFKTFSLQKNMSYEHYVDFNADVESLAHFKLEDHKINIQIDDPAFEIKKQWDPSYLKKHRVFKRIATKRLSKELRKTIDAASIDLDLPDLKLGNLGSLKFEDWALDSQDVQITLKLSH